MKLRQKLYKFGGVPVINIDDASNAAPLAMALKNGGLPVIEVTFRTMAAADAIKQIKEQCPAILVGAGTILTTDQIEQAIGVGADFMVAPGLNISVLVKAKQMNCPFIPGCVTASEVEQAIQAGVSFVKFFPAEVSNAKQVIKAFNGPYPNMHYMPTGGIKLDHLENYLSIPNITCCGGSWIARPDLISSGNFDQITKNARETITTVKQIRKN